MQKSKLFLNIIFGILWIIVLLLALNYITKGTSFDGAMNLLPAKNWAASGKYYSFYYGEYFPRPIQTRFTLQVPAAFFYYLFGVNAYTITLVPAIYTLIFAFVVYKLTNYLTDSPLSKLSLIICLLIPFFFRFSLRGFGEVITYIYVLLGLYFYIKSRHSKQNIFLLLLAGFCIGMAIVTKTVAFIVIPSLGLIVLYDMWINRQIEYKILLALAGVLMAIGVYVIFQITLMGWEDYVPWINRQYESTLKQAGVKATNSWQADDPFRGMPLPTIMYERFHITAQNTQFSSLHLLLLVLSFYAGAIYLFLKKEVKHTLKLFILFAIALVSTYLIWWLAITPYIKMSREGVTRRMLPTFIFIFMTLMIVVIHFGKQVIGQSSSHLNKKYLLGLICSGLILISPLFRENYLSGFTLNPSKIIKVPTSKPLITGINEVLQNEAIIFGYGYRQNPKIALQVNGHFDNIFKYDFDEILNIKEKYFFHDRYARRTKAFNTLLDVLEHEKVIDHKDGVLIKINGLRKDFPADTLAIFDNCVTKEELPKYKNKYGFFKKGKSQWAMPYSTVLLKGKNCQSLQLSLFVKDKALFFDGSGDITLTINEIEIYQGILQNGMNKLNIPLPEALKNIDEYQLSVYLDTYYTGGDQYYGIFYNKICLDCSDTQTTIQ